MARVVFTRKYIMRNLRAYYIQDGKDIFNYRISRQNPLTYHHIIKEEDLEALGFPTDITLENGIVLTKDAHAYLHLIEDFAPDIFFQINKIILLITREWRLPTLEERNLLQIFLEAFEYRMSEYYKINERFLRRSLVS